MKYLKLMRVKHYLKNVLVALPVIFAGVALHPTNIIKTLIAFITFSLTPARDIAYSLRPPQCCCSAL